MSNDNNPFQSPQTVTVASSRKTSTAIRRSSFKSGKTLGIVAIVAIWTTVLSWTVLSLVTQQDKPAGSTVVLVIVLLAALLLLTSILVAPITFIWWSYRVHSNLWSLGSRYVGWSNSWAIGAWFVPIGNLFIPFQVASETWYGSDPKMLGVGGSKARSSGIWIVRLWWGSWVSMNILFQIDSSVHKIEGDFEPLSVLIGLAALSAAGLATAMILKLNSNQQQRIEIVTAKREQAKAQEQPLPAAEEFPIASAPPKTQVDKDLQNMNMPWLDP